MKTARNWDPLKWAFAILWIVTIVPAWWPRELPLPGLPADLASARQLAPFSLAPPALYLLLLRLGGTVALKLAFSANAFYLPLSVLRLAERYGRSRWLSVFAFPLCWSMALGAGAIPFQFAVTLAIFALARLATFLESGAALDAALFFASSLAALSCHVTPFISLVVISLAWCALDIQKPRRVAVVLGLLAPAVLLCLRLGLVPALEPGATLELLERVPRDLVIVWKGDFAARCLVALGAAWIGLLWTARVAAPARPSWGIEVALVASALLAALLPHDADTRESLVPLVAVFGVLLPPGRVLSLRRGWLALACAAALAYPLALGNHLARFNDQLEILDRVLAVVPRGSSMVAVVNARPDDPLLDLDTYVRKRRSDLTIVTSRALSISDESQGYDFVMTYGEPTRQTVFGPNDGPLFPLIVERGDLRIYRVARDER